MPYLWVKYQQFKQIYGIDKIHCYLFLEKIIIYLTLLNIIIKYNTIIDLEKNLSYWVFKLTHASLNQLKFMNFIKTTIYLF